ncbi:hypothetical protein QBC43DRAFT_351772 [Cladorrhinum sp. PSN259]|nr:hypothetical protein QBC43DRAFT_351772 [Cladorrhinum sp. PSN259]
MATKEEKKWAMPQDWDEMKPTIKHLYLDQCMTLKKVVKEMDDKFNFKATETMYRKRIDSWGWKKNLSIGDFHALRQTRADDNAPARTQAHRLEQYENYRRRRDARRQSLASEQPATCTHLVPQPLRSLQLTGPLHDTETLLSHLQRYIDSSITSGTWVFDPSGGCRSRHGGYVETNLVEAWGRFDTVIQFMSREEPVRIGEILTPAFDTLRLAISSGTPRAFSFILSTLFTLQPYQKSDTRGPRNLVDLTLKHLSDTTYEVHGEHHWDNPFERVFEFLIRELAARLGSASPLVASVSVDFFDALFCCRTPSAQEHFIRGALERISKGHTVDAGLVKVVGEELRVRRQAVLRNLYCEQGKFDEAEALAYPNPFPSSMLDIWQMQSLGHVKRHRGNLVDAKDLFYQAFKLAENLSSFKDEQWVQPILIDLEDICERLGQSSEAAGFKTIRADRVGRLIGCSPSPITAHVAPSPTVAERCEVGEASRSKFHGGFLAGNDPKSALWWRDRGSSDTSSAGSTRQLDLGSGLHLEYEPVERNQYTTGAPARGVGVCRKAFIATR